MHCIDRGVQRRSGDQTQDQVLAYFTEPTGDQPYINGSERVQERPVEGAGLEICNELFKRDGAP